MIAISVVVAIRDEDKIWLATDSQVTAGWTKSLITSQHSFKIFKVRNNINIGGVGSLRDINIISTSDTEFICENTILKNEINFKEIVRDTVPKFFQELEKFSRVERENGVPYLNSQFIIAHKDQCYMICEDGAAMELSDMMAIGSGANVAESAYTVLRDTSLTPKEKAVRSVISACERDLFVDYPIVVTNTLTDEFEIFDGNVFYRIEDGELIEIEEEEVDEEDECDCCNCPCKSDENNDIIEETEEEKITGLRKILRRKIKAEEE